MKRLLKISSLASIVIALAVGCKSDASPSNPQPIDDNNEQPIANDDTLFNGIVLPKPWPPRRSHVSDLENGMQVPYLQQKPDIINISVGRQLFVDDFLIASTNMNRKFHYAEYHSSNPILKPDKPWENIGTNGNQFAAPFSDGVWYDEKESKFKMWYMAGGEGYSDKSYPVTCYAESTDGINWTKPNLSLISGTNIVDKDLERDANTVWLDKDEENPNLRYKMFTSARDQSDNKWKYIYKTSSDGKLWREQAYSKPIADRSTVYRNSFRDNWVFSIRHNIRVNPDKLVRARDYYEHKDPVAGTRNAEALLSSFWFGPWANELRHPNYPNVEPAIYNHDAIPYESIMLGLFSVWQGPENDIASNDDVPKRNQIMLGYSRDGFHWHREDMNPFLAVSEHSTDWNAGNLQSVVGSPIIIGDRLFFYLSGRRYTSTGSEITSTGLAYLRRDGFVSMDATNGEQILITEKLMFNGAYFFVNADISGRIKVEILNEEGEVIPGFSKSDCEGFTGNSVKQNIKWKSNANVASLKNQVIKIKFYVDQGSLYSFWISPKMSGESQGYTSGGGTNLSETGKDI